ncbi:MAG: hypothetical protein SGJ17_06235 [Hyphomicrobiales bacterium]|nr:hypothetical protein [Hyphomicrobiales bacterium]
MSTQDGDNAAPKKERFGTVKRVYDWYDKVDTWRERIDLLVTLIKANTVATASTVTAGVVVTTGAVVVATNPRLIDEWFPPAPPPVAIVEPVKSAAVEPPKVEVTTQRWGEAVVFPINGVDAGGRRAAFDVAVLPKEYTWARKDDKHLARDGRTLADAEVQALFSDDFRTGIGRSADVIGVGVASQEGDVVEESGRAARRALTAGGWLATARGEGALVWQLNLGQYKGTCASADKGDTSWQRPVIMVGVREKDEGVNLGEALGDAMTGKSNLPSRDCYSNFTMERRQ